MTSRLATLLAVACLAGCAADLDTGPPPIPTATSLDEVVPPTDPYRVKFETSKGDFVIEVHPDWAPRGAARFEQLVGEQFYDGCRFFRVLPDFMVQFGLNGDPETQIKWKNATFRDDPAQKSNRRGTITFATSGSNSRTSQVFINFKDNSQLDTQGFTPFGEVVEGMEVVASINSEYGETPDQGQIQERGNEYLNAGFPNLDFIKTARIDSGGE